ncbi:thiosulfate oxidation carrier protein SoxY [Teichococcus vastitatis]|uniref:Thiosulfate oxidation carrier protein SoxY n=1 Tax=Teichococcus vastitatis TaxID=2307076 RepID=A0ABS9W6L0_9PROT|nr:thiosulfate oxidation carrier protein SoxY [Pseudoroseomonas vastitatis]MCI0754927.1 thiosulfate oxidation carrier protein SoxY [Pseudoroseomonas vastitatis]
MTVLSRRALFAASLVVTGASGAAAEDFAAALNAILKDRGPDQGGIALEVPPLSENGNSVDLSVRVDSPMTTEDHVTAIHILAEKNPFPLVATFSLTPRTGRAEVATRIRLATSQKIVAIAETSQGVVHQAARDVIVVLGACVETG